MNPIRIYRTTNVKAVRSLDTQIWASEYLDDFRGHELWLAKRGDKLVGYASLRLVDGGSAAFLAKVGVLPEARGNGLQKRLIRVRERRARELGAKAVITYVASWNLPSANSLIRQGYALYRPATVWGLPRSRCLYFYKSL